jgi:hypothetical protein
MTEFIKLTTILHDMREEPFVQILFTLKFSHITSEFRVHHLVCNCWLANTISYIICTYVYGLSVYHMKLLHYISLSNGK